MGRSARPALADALAREVHIRDADGHNGLAANSKQRRIDQRLNANRLGTPLPAAGDHARRSADFGTEVLDMQVHAWSNGSPRCSGAGYGIRVGERARESVFHRSWDRIDLDLGVHGHADITLSNSFWRGCTELRNAAVGRWLLSRGLAPWPRGEPPTLELQHLGGRNFRLTERQPSR